MYLLSNEDFTPNYIINGAFDYWQMFGPTYSLYFGTLFIADRWRWEGGSSNWFFQRMNISTTLNPEIRYCFNCYTTTSCPTSKLEQFVIDVRKVSNCKVTFSFYAIAFSGETTGYELRFTQVFKGSPDNIVFSTPLTLTNQWKRYVYVFDIPSVEGKTIGADSYLKVSFFIPAASQINYGITGVMLQKGTKLNPFKRAGINETNELILCQYFFEKSYDLDIGVGKSNTYNGIIYSIAEVGQSMIIHIPFKVTKYKTPSVSCFSPQTGFSNYIRDLSSNNDYQASIYNISSYGATAITSSAGTEGHQVACHFSAGAEIWA